MAQPPTRSLGLEVRHPPSWLHTWLHTLRPDTPRPLLTARRPATPWPAACREARAAAHALAFVGRTRSTRPAAGPPKASRVRPLPQPRPAHQSTPPSAERTRTSSLGTLRARDPRDRALSACQRHRHQPPHLRARPTRRRRYSRRRCRHQPRSLPPPATLPPAATLSPPATATVMAAATARRATPRTRAHRLYVVTRAPAVTRAARPLLPPGWAAAADTSLGRCQWPPTVRATATLTATAVLWPRRATSQLSSK